MVHALVQCPLLDPKVAQAEEEGWENVLVEQSHAQMERHAHYQMVHALDSQWEWVELVALESAAVWVVSLDLVAVMVVPVVACLVPQPSVVVKPIRLHVVLDPRTVERESTFQQQLVKEQVFQRQHSKSITVIY
jgi:hypothetical protein